MSHSPALRCRAKLGRLQAPITLDGPAGVPSRPRTARQVARYPIRSPKFVEGTNLIVAITTGGDGNCRSLSYNYRLDSPEARAFLEPFVPLP